MYYGNKINDGKTGMCSGYAKTFFPFVLFVCAGEDPRWNWSEVPVLLESMQHPLSGARSQAVSTSASTASTPLRLQTCSVDTAARQETRHYMQQRPTDITNICHHGMGAGTGEVNIRNNSRKKADCRYYIVDKYIIFITKICRPFSCQVSQNSFQIFTSICSMRMRICTYKCVSLNVLCRCYVRDTIHQN